jgi:membrane fusion protein (multidrug efflux system)
MQYYTVKNCRKDYRLGQAVLLLFLLSLILICPACKKKKVEGTAEKAINIRVQAVEKRSFRPFVESIGTLMPGEEVMVSSEIEGVLKSVRVDEGTVVSKGMLLAIIDDTNYSLEVRRTEITLKQAEATLENTRLEYQRKDALYREELVTKQQFDDVSTRLSLAMAEVERAKATCALSKERLSKTGIHSPIHGIIKEKRVSIGDYVRNGTNLFVVIQNNPLKLNFTITEKDVGKLRVGQDVIFRVDAFPGKEFKGSVRILYPSLEERTRTLQVEARVPNHDGLLKPGLFANVTLYTGGQRDTTVVPITSILYDDSKTKVFVIEGHHARERGVKIGSKYGELIEIVEGLEGKEMVVIVGQNNLSEGVKVNVAR